MKTLNEYMALPYKMEIVEDKEGGVFVISFPDLPGCITCGETVESAVANAMEAKEVWLKAAQEKGMGIQFCLQDPGIGAPANHEYIASYRLL